jgi:hypothetical protein
MQEDATKAMHLITSLNKQKTEREREERMREIGARED